MLVRTCAALALAVLLAAPVAAQEAPDRWAFTVTPYFTFPHMNGEVGVGPATADLDVGPDEIFDNLQFGAMLGLEAAKGPWAIVFNGLYMDLGKDGEQLPVRLDSYQGALELAGLRRLTPWLEVLAGGRLNLLGASASATVAGTERRFETDKAWFDPFLGARAQVPGTGKWRLWARGDVGGFGIGSDFAWQARVGVGYRLSRTVELGAAYWAVGMDYEDDGGTVPFRWDVTTFGPQVGVALHF